MINKRLFFIFILFQTSFMECTIIDSNIAKLLLYVFTILLFIWIFAKKKRCDFVEKDKKNEALIKLIICGILLSIIPAVLIEGQSVVDSIIPNLQCLIVYLTYFLARKLSISAIDINNVILTFAILVCIVVLFNLYSFPNVLFGSADFDFTRGGFIRIVLSSYFFVIYALFYSLNKYIENKKNKQLLLSLAFFLIIVSSLSRVYIALSLFLSVVMLMKYYSTNKKQLMICSIIIGIIIIIIPQTDLYKSMKELSVEQAERNEYEDEDIRVKDYNYFFIESQETIIQTLIGHGLDRQGITKYGKRQEIRRDSTHILEADVGWAGLFYFYGLFTFILVVLLVFKQIFHRYDSENRHVQYFMIFYAISAISSGNFLFPIMNLVFILSVYYISCTKQIVTE